MGTALAVVGAVAVLNLLLTFGVIRRLREHTELLGAQGSGTIPTMIAVGESIAPFSTTTVDGRPVSNEGFSGSTLIGVFGVGCAACETKLPKFVESAQAHPGGRAHVLVVVADGDDDAAALRYVERLTGVANVVRESREGPVHTALGVAGYPAFALVDPAGVVRATALDPARLQVLAAT
jgi:hypothetical protein